MAFAVEKNYNGLNQTKPTCRYPLNYLRVFYVTQTSYNLQVTTHKAVDPQIKYAFQTFRQLYFYDSINQCLYFFTKHCAYRKSMSFPISF